MYDHHHHIIKTWIHIGIWYWLKVEKKAEKFSYPVHHHNDIQFFFLYFVLGFFGYQYFMMMMMMNEGSVCFSISFCFSKELNFYFFYIIIKWHIVFYIYDMSCNHSDIYKLYGSSVCGCVFPEFFFYNSKNSSMPLFYFPVLNDDKLFNFELSLVLLETTTATLKSWLWWIKRLFFLVIIQCQLLKHQQKK